MDDIILSILIVTYNHEKYIEDTILSIVRQDTEYTFEIIIGDDASSDGTSRIINEYAQRYPQLIRPVIRKKNIGATKNSYGILKCAKGKYIAFCDGDDLWNDNSRIQRQVDFLEANPGYSAICGKSELVDESGKIIELDSIDKKMKFWEFDKSVFTKSDFESWKMPGHISAIMGKNFFRSDDCRILYKAHDVVGDRTLVLLFLFDGNICCTQDIVSYYRIHSKGNNFISEYKNNNLRYKDFYLMKMLEYYSVNFRNQKLNLSYIKTERLIGSIVVMINNPTFENLKVVCKIIIGSDELIKYFYNSIRVTFMVLYDKYVTHKNRKITL